MTWAIRVKASRRTRSFWLLDKNCDEKQKLYEENVKYRTQELAALSDTIKILNDDDALELFKKTLPGASSFVQVDVTSQAVRSRAIALIQAARGTSNRRPQLDFIALALRGKKIGFGKVLKMIEDLVKELKQDQVNDDGKKEYCNTELDTADDKKKVLEKGVSDLETAIVNSKDGIVSTKAEIEALDDGIKALDKAVAEATEQRKEENEDYTALMASDTAAKDLLGMARNRLNKFYNPKLYKAPPKRVLSAEDTIVVDMGGTLAPTNPPGGISGTGIAFVQVAQRTRSSKAAPGPAPEAPGAYKKKGE